VGLRTIFYCLRFETPPAFRSRSSYLYLPGTGYPVMEDNTRIFYMTDIGDILSIQFTMSLRGPKSVSKVDDLSLIFIDLYVPALTSCLNSTETSLQISENITLLCSITYKQVSSIKRLRKTAGVWDISFILI
jgi:hypothetical protein